MIKDKVIIITGASSGIGEATAKLLAGQGAKVVLGARRAQNLKRIADEIQQQGGQAVYQELDVTKQSENDAIVKLASWMELAKTRLTKDDTAVLADIGAILYRDGLKRRMSGSQ